MLEQRIRVLYAASARTDNRCTFLYHVQNMLVSGATTARTATPGSLNACALAE